MCMCVLPCECLLIMNDLLCTSACRCVMNDPVCVLYPVSVHCLFMNAPVYACVDYTCECSLSSHE